MREGQQGIDVGQVMGTNVSGGEDLQHAGHLQCISGADAVDRGMRLRAANKGHIVQMGQLDVVPKLALTSQQGVVFSPQQGLLVGCLRCVWRGKGGWVHTGI